MKNSGFSRRNFLSLGATAVVGSLITTTAVASNSRATPEQAEGPFFPKHRQADKNADMTQIEGIVGRATGEIITIAGRVLDTDGKPVNNALIDIWQADHKGRYRHEDAPETSPLDTNFQYWAQLKTGEDGSYNIKTIKPGKYPAIEDWIRPPHIHFKVARRGMRELTTQMYFANEPLNKKDRLYLGAPESERGSIVVDIKHGKGEFNIILAKV